jgi:tetratricopeptide (TPR) repeat protein
VTRSTAWAFRYARHFLAAFVNGETASRHFLDATPRDNGVPDSVARVEWRLAARRATPPVEELKQRYRRNGMDGLIALHAELSRDGVPPGHETYRLLGSWLLDQGDGRDGVRWLRIYLDDYPSSSRAHYYYAAACSRLQQKQEAREHFQRALDLLPVDPELDAPTRFRLERRARASLETLGN